VGSFLLEDSCGPGSMRCLLHVPSFIYCSCQTCINQAGSTQRVMISFELSGSNRSMTDKNTTRDITQIMNCVMSNRSSLDGVGYSHWSGCASGRTDCLSSEELKRRGVRPGRVTRSGSGLRGLQPYSIARSFGPLVDPLGPETRCATWEFLSYYPKSRSTRHCLCRHARPEHSMQRGGSCYSLAPRNRLFF
jgi:hypothetical protein